MHKKAFWRLLGAGVLCILTGTATAGGDPAAGKSKFTTCAGCHSIPGYNNVYPTYHVPRLGGQSADYIISALKAYQSGERKHPTMHANAATLGEQDMADIAAYLASFKPTNKSYPVVGNAVAGKKKAAVCASCHGTDGVGTAPNFPRLAGQHEDYLRQALRDYHTGERKNAVMMGQATTLTDQDIADLAAYFASLGKGLVVVEE